MLAPLSSLHIEGLDTFERALSVIEATDYINNHVFFWQTNLFTVVVSFQCVLFDERL